MITIPLTVLAIGVGAVGAVAVVRTHRRGASVGEVLRAGMAWLGMAALGGFVAVVIAATVGPVRMFGVIHYAYLVGVVSLPMLGVAAGVAMWRVPKQRGARDGWRLVPWLMVALLLLPAPIGFYATHVEPGWLRVDHLDVVLPVARDGDDPVSVGVMADLQTNDVGAHEHEAVDELLAAEPDVILIPGDLFHGNDTEYERELVAMQELLGRLTAPHGVYMVQGDAEAPGWWPRLLEGTEIVVLDDEVVDLQIGDRTVRIGGHTLHPGTEAADAVRAELQATTDPGAITILVAHRPDTVLHLPDSSRVDLTVAGHTHGGQIVVPGFGPLVTLSDVPRDVARGGLSRVDGNQIYVSPGVGIERGDAPQVRLFNRPAVAILTLR